MALRRAPRSRRDPLKLDLSIRQPSALPVLPAIATSVLSLANNPSADAADLSDLIHQDQTLAGNVLRIANSPAYRTGDAIVSLRQAVLQLGFSVLSEIAVAACLNADAFRAPGFEPLRKRLLAHAFVTGGFAKELARRKRRNVEALFLCGLLHSVGRTVALRLVAEAHAGAAERPAEADVLPVLDAHEAELGARVTAAWNLPPQVQTAAAHHRAPEQAPAFVDETRTVALAAALATWGLQDAAHDEAVVRTLPAWAGLNYYPDEVDAVLERRPALLEAAAIFLA